MGGLTPPRIGLLKLMCILRGSEVSLEPIYGELITLKRQLELGDIRFINFIIDTIPTTSLNTITLLHCLHLFPIVFPDDLLLLKPFQDFVVWF